MFDPEDHIVLGAEDIEKIVDATTIWDAEELIRALATKHRFVLGLIDRSQVCDWVRAECQRKEFTMDPDDLFQMEDSIVEEAQRRIYAEYGNAHCEEIMDEGTFRAMEGIVYDCFDPLNRLSDNTYTYGVTLADGSNPLLTATGFGTFADAHTWGESHLHQDIHDMLSGTAEAGVTLEKKEARYLYDQARNFWITATNTATGARQVFDVRSY